MSTRRKHRTVIPLLCLLAGFAASRADAGLQAQLVGNALLRTVAAQVADEPAAPLPDMPGLDSPLIEQLRERLRENTRRILLPQTTDEERIALFEKNERIKELISSIRDAGISPDRREQEGEGDRTEVDDEPVLTRPEFSTATIESLLDLYRHFDRLDRQGHRGASANRAKMWQELTEEFDRHMPAIDQHIRKHGVTPQHYGAFIVRSILLLGESRIFAAAEHCKIGNARQCLEHYMEGIAALERVILLATPDIEKLRPFDRNGPKARLEIVGATEITNEGPQQMCSSTQARRILSSSCPWGRQVFLLLEETGVTQSPGHDGKVSSLDFSILDAFAEADAKYSCDLTLPEERVPLNIRREMQAIMGDSKAKTGVLTSGGKSRKIEWHGRAVGYRLTYVSPNIFDISRDAAVWLGFKIIAVVLLGPKFVAAHDLLDWSKDLAMEYVPPAAEEYFGKGSNVYHTTYVLAEGFRIANTANDYIVNPDPNTYMKAVASMSAKALEDSELEELSDKLSPEVFATGLTYSKSYVPPILITAELYGVEATRDYEYPRSWRILRSWKFHPEALAYKGGVARKYDLSGEVLTRLPRAGMYTSGTPTQREAIHEAVWRKLPMPFGGREYLTEIIPKGQVLSVTLDTGRFRKWSSRGPGENQAPVIEALVHAPAGRDGQDYEKEPLLKVRIEEPKVLVQLFRPGVFGSRNPDADKMTREIREMYERRIEEIAIRYPGAVAGMQRYCMAPLFTEYTLRILRNGSAVERILLNLGPPPPKKKKPMLGTLTGLQEGVVRFAYVHRPEKDRIQPISIGAAIPDDLLPARLALEVKQVSQNSNVTESTTWITRQNKVHHVSAFKHCNAVLTGYLTGQNLRMGSHVLNLRVNGVPYVMHGVLKQPQAGIRFDGWIPVRMGQSDVVATAEGAPALQFTIERVPKEKKDIDWNALKAKLDRAQQAWQRNPGDRYNPGKLVAACSEWTEACLHSGQYKSVPNVARLALQAIPPGTMYKDRYKSLDLDKIFRARTEAAWFDHDIETLRGAVGDWLERRRRAMLSHRGTLNAYDVKELAKDCETLLWQWISVGGDAATAQRIWQVWLDCLGRCSGTDVFRYNRRSNATPYWGQQWKDRE